jgi:hypothetical protein
VSLDGDFDKVVAVGEDGKLIPLYNQNNLDDTLLITNPHGLKREYSAIILSATKRLSERWQMLVSYARSRATGNIDNVYFSSNPLQGSNYGPSPFLDTPNSLFNGDGTLTDERMS